MKQKNIFVVLTVFLSSFAALLALGWFLQSQHAGNKIFAWMMDAEYLGSEGVVTQTKRNNCGPSALKMIFDHFNIPSSLEEIERGVKLSKNGSSMLALKEMAELKGLRTEGWRLTLEEFLKCKFPVVLFVHGNHYVVADSVLSDTLFLRDPAIGKLRLQVYNLPQIWKGETLVFTCR